jgi:hypothetical protein
MQVEKTDVMKEMMMATQGTKMKQVEDVAALQVSIKNGRAVPPSTPIPNNGTVVFTNNDPAVRYLQFFDSENTYHPALFIQLQPAGTATLTSGWNSDDQDTVCPYNVRIFGDIPPAKQKDSGGNKIIIGSGPMERSKSKKRAK